MDSLTAPPTCQNVGLSGFSLAHRQLSTMLTGRDRQRLIVQIGKSSSLNLASQSPIQAQTCNGAML
jgi:hypothetical protein